jgi:hypothetical protein
VRGLRARHRVGDELVVVAPALVSHLRYWASDDGDEVVIVPPSAAVNWQARDLAERTRRRFTVPIARAA